LGIGFQQALGGQIDYYWLPARSPIHFAIYFGAGWFLPGRLNDVVPDGAFGVAGGAFAFIGHHHRGLLDVSYGIADIQGKTFGHMVLEQYPLHGPRLARQS